MQMVARPLYSAFLHYKMNIFLSVKVVHSFFLKESRVSRATPPRLDTILRHNGIELATIVTLLLDLTNSAEVKNRKRRSDHNHFKKMMKKSSRKCSSFIMYLMLSAANTFEDYPSFNERTNAMRKK